MTKIYYNGKRVNTPLNRFKHSMKVLFKRIVLIVITVGVIVGIYEIGSLNSNRIVYRNQEVILDNLTGKVNELKGQLVSEIKQCESGGIKEEDGLVTFDPHPKNKKVQVPSFGSYQFKKSTVQYYYKKFYDKDISGKEAILIALDDQKAGELTSDIIFKDEALNNWFNCSKKLNSRAKLDIINNLLK